MDNPIHFKIIYRSKPDKWDSTLLIPEDDYRFFKNRINTFKGCKNYLCFLLIASRSIIKKGSISYPTKKIIYQRNGLNLKRFNFKPLESDWVQLRLYANTFGVSMTSLFVILLKMDKDNLLSSKNITGTPQIKILIFLPASIHSPILHKKFHLRP